MPRHNREWKTYSPRSYIFGRCEFCGASPTHGPRGSMLCLARYSPGWQYRGRPPGYQRYEGVVIVRCPACGAAGRDDEKGGQHG